MPNEPDANQISLFPEDRPALRTPARTEITADDVQRSTYRTQDEIAWEKQQHRRSQPVVPNTMSSDGPACGRCELWTAPEKPRDFGHCRIRVVVTERVPGVAERGDVLERHAETLYLAPRTPLRAMLLPPVEPLRTRAGFACTSYAEAAGKAAA